MTNNQTHFFSNFGKRAFNFFKSSYSPTPSPSSMIDLTDEGLTVTDICKTYDNRGVVLDHVTFTVKKDSFFTLLGPSACGKSTLLKIIAGLEQQNNGSIHVGKTDITNFPAQARPINMVFQNFALFPHLTVFENIAFGLKALNNKKEKYQIEVLKAMERLKLLGLEDVYPGELSGGQQQRVALARALVNKPHILLLDEPMSHLDDYLKAKVAQDLRDLQAELKNIFIMVTHDREDALAISTEMAILNNGKILQQGTPGEIFSAPKTCFVANFMGKTNTFEAERDPNNNKKAILPFMKLEYKDALTWIKKPILINPEGIEIVEKISPGEKNCVKAMFDFASYRGYNKELHFLIPKTSSSTSNGKDDSVKLLVLKPAETVGEYKHGQSVYLKFDLEKIFIFVTSQENNNESPFMTLIKAPPPSSLNEDNGREAVH